MWIPFELITQCHDQKLKNTEVHAHSKFIRQITSKKIIFRVKKDFRERCILSYGRSIAWWTMQTNEDVLESFPYHISARSELCLH